MILSGENRSDKEVEKSAVGSEITNPDGASVTLAVPLE